MNDLLSELEPVVEEACEADSNAFGYGIWTHHITRVVENARALAPRYGADQEIVELAALLHDYASVKDEALYDDHHVHGPREAERLLAARDYPRERTERVKRCIANHRGSIEDERDSPEATCLASADAMAHIQHPHSLLYLAYDQHGMGIDEGATWVQEKIERSWEKMDPIARDHLEGRHEAVTRFFDGLCGADA